MKFLFFGLAGLAFAGCLNNRPDGMYEGPVMNAKCALEVYPVEVAKEVKEMPAPDTLKKEDPLIRQNGLNVCRAF